MTALNAPQNISLRRKTDLLCQAKPPFCVSGIPGVVGGATRACWQELAPLLRSRAERTIPLRIWPFDGPLDDLCRQGGVILAELYPALAYTVALSEALPAHRIRIAKTKRDQRELALRVLMESPWRSEYELRVDDPERVISSEDEFDAMLAVIALSRLCLRGQPLDEPTRDDPIAEGGILLTRAIKLGSDHGKLLKR